MKCKYCGAELPDDANFCAKCAKPLKDNLPDIPSGIEDGGNTEMQLVEKGVGKQNTKFGLVSLIIGLVSMILSCIFLGFFGIVGIVFGIVSLLKKENRKGMAIAGIVCSAIAFLLSVSMLGIVSDESISNTTQQTAQTSESATETPSGEPTEEATEAPAEEPTATPKETLTSEEKKQEIQKLLLENRKENLKKYSFKEVNKVAGNMLKNLSFQNSKDYDTANTISQTMILVYSNEFQTENYQEIVSNYKQYIKTKKKLSSNDYKEIEKKWENISDVMPEVVSDMFYVNYNVESNSSNSKLHQILNEITGELREYKYAYFAQGCDYDYELDMWIKSEDEYIIYTHDAFPKAGEYSLNLVPTGEKMHVKDNSGFERDIDTYTILLEKDEKEYNRIEQLKMDYDILCDDMKLYKENIEFICDSF